jgi:RHS repeat-associated protein
MLNVLLASKWIRTTNIFAALNFVLTPIVVDASRSMAFSATLDVGNSLLAYDAHNSSVLKLTRAYPETAFLGAKVRVSNNRYSTGYGDVSVLIHCDRSDDLSIRDRSLIRNLTADCYSYSIYSTAPITIELPYRANDPLTQEIDERAIKVFRGRQELAAIGSLQPIESFVDIENKRTVATLNDQSGRYFAGVLKQIEGPGKAPAAFDSAALTKLQEGNPLTGVPIVEKPQANPMGDAKVTFPIEFPGARSDFRPSLSVSYVSKSGYGTFGESWHLDIPAISVETRWGVPIYDPEFETETYLFNGEQLVPETGESFVDPASGERIDKLQLLSLPHRTTYLRPRKKGEARFVQRRDDGLWRLIRHGDLPSSYWWEAWQEKPGNAAPRISYFGNAPGRISGAIERAEVIDRAASPGGVDSTYQLPVGPATRNPNSGSISKWVLAREVDAHRNIVDYDWQLDCQPGAACADADRRAGEIGSRDLLLRRIQYTSNLQTEETVLRCRDSRFQDMPGCLSQWALYEVLFGWLAPDGAYRRSDFKTGGLVVNGRLLDRIVYRGRQVTSDRLGSPTLKWACSSPFLEYDFAYSREFAGSDEGSADETASGSGRAFLKSVTKRVAANGPQFGTNDTATGANKFRIVGEDCSSYPAVSIPKWETSYTTRFSYDLTQSRPWVPAKASQSSTLERPATFGLADQTYDRLLGGDGWTGPIGASMLGTTATSDVNISFYGGLNFFDASKVNSFGVKIHSLDRTGYVESTTLIDVDGDGIADLVIRKGEGDYSVHRGKLGSNGSITFGPGEPLSIPDGFVGFNREPFQSTMGFAVESHLFGSFVAGMSSNTSTVQDTYVADVDGDGRPDIVSNGSVLFNTSTSDTLSFSGSQRGGFIDPRVRPGLGSPANQVAVDSGGKASTKNAFESVAALVQKGSESQSRSENSPRIDPVRIWRAPFSGDVIVHGTISYSPPPMPSDVEGRVNDTDGKIRKVREQDDRDGVIFTVELNRERHWDDAGQVVRCFAATFPKDGPTVQLNTPAPGGRIQSCFQPNRPGWTAMPTLPTELGQDQGLLVSVEAGDIIYFRANSIDNAQDDVLQFVPAIDYFRLAEDTLGASAGNFTHTVIYGLGVKPPDPADSAVISSLKLASSVCASLDVTDQNGTVKSASEQSLQLCDPWGRSIVRYRGIEEKDQFVSGSGMLVAPFTGRMHFEGELDKPETALAGQIAIRILPQPTAPGPAAKDPACSPDQDAVPSTIYRSILNFGRAAGGYPTIDPANRDNSFFVNRGDKICIFLRFRSPDTNAPMVWPQDLSVFKWKTKLSAAFDRKLLVVPLDRADRNPDDLLTPADKKLPATDASECPAPPATQADVRLPPPGDPKNWPDPSTWSTKRIYVYPRCVALSERHWVAPRSLGATTGYFFADYKIFGPGPIPPATRLSRRLQTTKLPSSGLACPTDPNLREYRFRLDTSSLDQPLVPIDVDTRQPEALRDRPGIILKRSMLSLVTGTHREPVAVRAFTIRRHSGIASVSDSDLVTDVGQAKVDDQNAATYLTAQYVRRLPVIPATSPNPHNAFYADIKEGPPVNDQDNGIHVYPADRVGYSFCAPDQAEIEIENTIDKTSASPANSSPTSPFSTDADGFISTGSCGSICPLASATVHFAQKADLNISPLPLQTPLHLLQRLPIEAESYRGWGFLAVTTEFTETGPAGDALGDDGSIPENLGTPLGTDALVGPVSVDNLPVVRHFNRLRLRLAGRIGPVNRNNIDSQLQTANICGATAPDKCIREQYTSQIRVHVLTGDYRSQAITMPPTAWIYCTDNAGDPPKVSADGASAQAMSATVANRSGIDVAPAHYCSVGPDPGVWVLDDFMSASRLGRKNLRNHAVTYLKSLPLRTDEAKADAAAQKDTSAGRLVHLLPRASTTGNIGFAASWGVGLSTTSTDTTSLADTFDLNGDGFPDQIVENDAYLTDSSGRLRCLGSEVWATRWPCNVAGADGGKIPYGGSFVRESDGYSSALSIPFGSLKTFAMALGGGSARTGGSLSGQPPSRSQTSRDECPMGLSIGAEFSQGDTVRRSDIIDLNGDGLPDLVANGSAFFNRGTEFASLAFAIPGGLMAEHSGSVGLSAALGYGDDEAEFCGGISASSQSSRQTRVFADMNGDGLIDVVTIDGDQLTVSFNTGFGFSPRIAIGSVGRPFGALGQGETDVVGADAYFTFYIPIWIVYDILWIILNPGLSDGAAINRQVVSLRDMDADGLPDVVETGGLRVANDLQMMFDSKSATVHVNPFGTQGLLTRIYLPTNPEALKPDSSRQPDKANFKLEYARSSPSINDPQSRRVLAGVTVRDGVDLDDAFDVHDRKTCHSYEQGFYDRFERRFLGFARVVTVDGCATPGAAVQVPGNGDQLTGVRKIERLYANRSIYESGLLLSETTTDLSSPKIVAGSGSPTRKLENTYILVDVAQASRNAFACFDLGVSTGAIQDPSSAPPAMLPLLTQAAGGRIGLPAKCGALPDFDRDPKRLASALIQTVQTSTEGTGNEFRTAIQLSPDYRARVASVWDLGRLLNANGTIDTSDDVYASYEYDDNIQLSFIHGATGGGTLAFDRRDRVAEIAVQTSANDKAVIERRRTASYNPSTGDLVALCLFVDIKAPNLCRGLQEMPDSALGTVEVARAGSVAMHFYGYDAFGNLDRYISPVGADGYFLKQRFDFDPSFHLVELSQQSDYCLIGARAADRDPCPVGAASAPLGSLTSNSGDIDWRHAVATTRTDVNRNAIHTVLDGTGRPASVWVSWAGNWADKPNCAAGECSSLDGSKLKPGQNWGKLLGYDYRVGRQIAIPTSLARVTRFADAALYKKTGDPGVQQGQIKFESDRHYDELGRTVQSFLPSDICVLTPEGPDGATCDPANRGTHSASGIVAADVLDRAVQTFLPVSVAGLQPIDSASIVPTGNNHTDVVWDGLDRALSVRLPDGNGYALGYQVVNGAEGYLVHRTIARDGRCVPSVMDRDERGHIRAVHEFANMGPGTLFDGHATGSTYDASRTPAIVALGWVKAINTSSSQQVVSCNQGEATAGSSPVISSPLKSPFDDGNVKRRVSTTLYDYDALGQLTQVHLPKQTASRVSDPVAAGDKTIRVAYDPLGRRLATDDPDRGSEYLSYDLLSNVVCRRSGLAAGSDAAFDAVRGVFRTERERTAATEGTRRAGEDNCLTPLSANEQRVVRVVRNEFLHDRPAKTQYRFPIPVEGARKTVTIAYGHGDDFANNRAGRVTEISDVASVTTTLAYHPIGLAENTQKTIKSLDRRGAVDHLPDIGALSDVETHDSWGQLQFSTLSGQFSGLKSDGTSDNSTSKRLQINETVGYRYLANGQVDEISRGQCPALADGSPDCTRFTSIARIIKDAAADERGNLTRIAYGNGVVTRNSIDPASNRLMASFSRMGVECVEYGPGDDCSTSSPPVLFQNVSYSYDGSGHVVSYINAPKYADFGSAAARPSSCPATIEKDHAVIQGLLITGSTNRFDYDERSRIQASARTICAYGKDVSASSFDGGEFAKAALSRFTVDEAFAFTDSHLLTGIQQSLQAAGSPQKTTILHTYAADRATAPAATSVKLPLSNQDEKFEEDALGRIKLVRCTGCLKAKVTGETALDLLRNQWDPDDTLSNVTRRTEPTEKQTTDTQKRSRYFTEVQQNYDREGNRAVKRAVSLTQRPAGTASPAAKLDRETIYPDPRLTIVREPGNQPTAMLHVFAGRTRLASMWTGDAAMFTYHAQLSTESVSDVVYSRSDNPTTAQLRQQVEYAAFGDMLLNRQRISPEPGGGSVDRSQIARPLYRFDAKELDAETGFTYFGARHYDQRLGLWLMPDPAHGQYLEGKLNGGVFAPKNLAAYGFGWGNPISNSDGDGRVVELGSIGELAKNQWDEFRSISGTQWLGALKAVGGACEAAAGACLASTTGWTVAGAAAGGVVTLHGLDQVQAGIRQFATNKHTSSATSNALQSELNISQKNADRVDAGISFVGSLGASFYTAAAKLAAARAADPILSQGMSNVELLGRIEIGSQAMPTPAFNALESIAPTALQRSFLLNGPGYNAAKGLTLIFSGPTPGGNLLFGVGGAIGGSSQLAE